MLSPFFARRITTGLCRLWKLEIWITRMLFVLTSSIIVISSHGFSQHLECNCVLFVYTFNFQSILLKYLQCPTSNYAYTFFTIPPDFFSIYIYSIRIEGCSVQHQIIRILAVSNSKLYVYIYVYA